jgi:hypothetical protein
VLKQSWRPTTCVPEGSLYPRLNSDNIHVGQIHSYEDVLQDSAIVDTQNFIRQGLEHLSPNPPDTNANGKRANAALEGMENRERYLEIALAGERSRLHIYVEDLDPIWRALTRELSRTFGWPFQCFRDIPELLKVSSHFVRGKNFMI